MKRFTAYIAMLLPWLCSAQSELPGANLNIIDYAQQSHIMPQLVNPDTVFRTHTSSANSSIAFTVGNRAENKPIFINAGIANISGGSAPFSWYNGGVVFAGSVTRMPGLMQIDSGSMGLRQSFGNFTIYGGALVNKYGYFRGVTTQYGLEGRASYKFSENISLSTYASYYFGGVPVRGNGLPFTPAMIGYFDTSKFGWYIDYKVNDIFGVQVGAQTVQRFGTNQYRVEPIVTPYFKVGKVAFGLPVGQIVHGVIRDQINKRDFKHPRK